jgi:predicted RNase H-like HicB family nuclease
MEGSRNSCFPSGAVGILDPRRQADHDVDMRYRVVLFESEEGWAVSCPDLPGCHSQGATLEEALESIRDAIRLWLEVEAEETGLKRLEQAEVTV